MSLMSLISLLCLICLLCPICPLSLIYLLGPNMPIMPNRHPPKTTPQPNPTNNKKENTMEKRPVDKQFLRQGKDYTTLICYKKAVIIYDITYHFAHKYLERGDRTIDQMIQAARSGKQNIVEGNIDGITSTEMEIKLTNVNRASLHELLEDYKDYLRVHGLEQWPVNSPKAEQTRRYCATHNAPEDYTQKIAERSAETICNIAITLILQTDVMIKGLIEWQKNHFKDKGGIKEQLYNERRKQRGY